MSFLLKIFGWLTVAPLKDYRTQVLGMVVAFTAIVNAVAGWAVGDLSMTSAFSELAARWAELSVGFALIFGGDKLNALSGKKTTAQLFNGEK